MEDRSDKNRFINIFRKAILIDMKNLINLTKYFKVQQNRKYLKYLFYIVIKINQWSKFLRN